MSDFTAFSEDIDAGMEFLEHFGILGQKHGQRNGPPYPLGSGKHSSSEKRAAEAAGVSVGEDSGTGSIENVKKKKKKKPAPKKELTPEEKRAAALEAVKTGDKKKISKYIDQLSTEELRDAQNRAQMRDSLTKKDPSEQKMSKADVEKMDAMRSGDKERIKEYASQMTNQELREAMDRVDLNAKLNRVDPPPSISDKIDETMAKIDRARGWAEKGIGAYNTIAKVYNSTHNDSKWPIIDNGNKEKSKEEKKQEEAAKQVVKEVGKDVAKGVQDTRSYKEKAAEKLENDKIDYKNEKKLEKWKEKQEAKEAKKEAKEEVKAAKKASNDDGTEEESTSSTTSSSSKSHSNDDDESSSRSETSFKTAAKKKVADEDISYDEIMEPYKDAMSKPIKKSSSDDDDDYDWFYEWMNQD